jgi:hypothetical protein
MRGSLVAGGDTWGGLHNDGSHASRYCCLPVEILRFLGVCSLRLKRNPMSIPYIALLPEAATITNIPVRRV